MKPVFVNDQVRQQPAYSSTETGKNLHEVSSTIKASKIMMLICRQSPAVQVEELKVQSLYHLYSLITKSSQCHLVTL